MLKRCSNCKSNQLVETYFSIHKRTGLYYRTCDTCRTGGRKHTFDECRLHAESKGGLCLSKKYVNCDTQMSWECSEGHRWDSNFDHIKNRDQWCAICAGRVRLTITDCREFAESKGGKCLSEIYVNAHSIMSWQCIEGHQWQTAFNNIKYSGYWCPTCSSNKSEKLCRGIFEELLLEPFSKIRPPWLERLELDGYNKDLNIAFEYNGKQHYEFNKHFHNNSPEEFEQQKARDIKKYSICQQRGLNLIIIPYQYDYRNPEEMRDFIFNELWKIS
jgi:hypothetical protein